jgi:radical SAM protein with 4Fe4S-binding SPASM domain
VIKDVMKLPLLLFYSIVGNLYPEDDRIALRLFEYFPTSAYKVQGILIEPTNICNLKCRHCTTQSIPNNKKGNMSLNLFRKILDDNPQLTCIILTRNGEPFTHRYIFEMIRFARDKGIYVTVYTNGILLNEEKITRIFESDLSEINFSMEGVGDYYNYNRGKPYDAIKSVINRLIEERNKRGSRLKIGINATIAEDIRYANAVKKEWENIVDFVTIEPLMGNSRERRSSSCRTLWRNLVITWNGDVLPCCVDMYGKLLLGNVNRQSLREIFNGPKVKELRKRHLRSDFPKICSLCHPYHG